MLKCLMIFVFTFGVSTLGAASTCRKIYQNAVFQKETSLGKSDLEPLIRKILKSDEIVRETLPSLTQKGADEITDGFFTVKIVDLDKYKVDIKRLQTKKAAPNELENYILQVFHTVRVAAQFYRNLGVEVPKVFLKLQDPEAQPVAVAHGKIIEVSKITDQLSLREFQEFIRDVITHEMAHIIQGKDMLRLLESRIGATSYEGHANLMSYLVLGKTDLGVMDGEPGMQVLNQAKFGRTSGSSYSAYDPFASILVKIHQMLLQRAKSFEDKRATHLKISKRYLELISKQKLTDDYQSLLKKTIDMLTADKLILDGDKDLVASIASEHGMDIEGTKSSGYTSAVLVNGAAGDMSGSENLANAKMKGLNPKIQLQGDFLKEFYIDGEPVIAIVSDPVPSAQLNKVMQEKSAQLLKIGTSMDNPEVMRKLIFESYLEVARLGVDLGGVFVDKPIIEFKDTAEIEIQAQKGKDKSRCKEGFVLGAVVVFSSQRNIVANAPVLFACR